MHARRGDVVTTNIPMFWRYQWSGSTLRRKEVRLFSSIWITEKKKCFASHYILLFFFFRSIRFLSSLFFGLLFIYFFFGLWCLRGDSMYIRWIRTPAVARSLSRDSRAQNDEPKPVGSSRYQRRRRSRTLIYSSSSRSIWLHFPWS